jgi:uncharacterized membrane protein YadS
LALAVGTTVKLARALWIVPVSVATAAAKRSKDSMAMVHRVILPGRFGEHLFDDFARPVSCPAGVGKNRLVTLFLIGTGISKETLRRVGARPLAQGVFLWTIVSVSSLLMIRFGWIHL